MNALLSQFILRDDDALPDEDARGVSDVVVCGDDVVIDAETQPEAEQVIATAHDICAARASRCNAAC